ncbi:MAG: extracellular solute-binding protein, partial [Ruminococcus flavefaciens]|nr:extracellular solute-binding protein [Ruminococcus flavefaciens]
QQNQVLFWQTHTLLNTNGYYNGDYSFYLEQGQNVVRIIGSGTEFLLGGLTVNADIQEPTYKEYLSAASGVDTSGFFIKMQGENAAYKSDSVLYPNYDRVNLATEDSSGGNNNPQYIRINTIGGNLWNTEGQWISWEVEVPESGYYNLGCKFRQNYLDGLFTSRAVYIDGEILFSEMSGIRFSYDDEWQAMTFSDENGEPFKIYLEEGTHEIKLMCTMGEFSDTLRNVNDCIYEVNSLYRQIIMITSTDPDAYTDYFLTERIPGLLDTIRECSLVLEGEINKITTLTGEHGSQTAVLDTLRIQLNTFLDDVDEIPTRLSNFKDNISAVGSWLVNIQSQGLQIDYLFLKSPDVETPAASAGFWKNAWYSVRRFFASFDDSASNVSTDDAGGSHRITVWLNSASGTTSVGRDQAQIIKDLIDENFTPETGVVVDLQLVQGSLIEATLAGTGPDVALMVAEDQPVNFAIRGALQDLTDFPDYEEVLGRFYESSVTPFWHEGGLYALPDTQIFNMLFYRTDVFEELGIEVPETWEDFYSILPVIQRNNLQITVLDIFPALLLQNGGSYYSEDGTESLLDSQVAIDAMTTYTDLYVKYGFEVKTDFYSRFRSGELVMSIQPYNMYNQLMVAAPEINGLWEMAPIPGVKGEDGSIDNSQNATVTGSVMLDSCEDKEAAWEFMKWWSRDDVKAEYAVALEGMLGASARFTPSNIGTLSLLPWSDEELAILTSAWENVIGIPQLPGSYYTARGLTNAFRSIVYNEEFPQYAMRLQTRYINEEIARKREEFGLNTR